MNNISRKNTLGIHLKRFSKEFPQQYNFFPQTWLYPSDFHDINQYYTMKLNKRKLQIKEGSISDVSSPVVLFICKPEASCQGKGIFICRKLDDMRQQLNHQFQVQSKQYDEYLQAQENYDTAYIYSQQPRFISQNQDQSQVYENGVQPPQAFEKNNSYVVQKYIKQPALINGHKFDFRIYVLVTSVIEPLTIFMFKDGLVRLASEKYELNGNIQDLYVHLTNYSLNKKNEHFDGQKHKLRLSDCLKSGMTSKTEKGTFRKSSEEIWLDIEDIIIKTTITVQPQLQHYYRSCQPKEPDICYELLGFDIMLDSKLKAWLLEVNHLPSFNSDTQVDEQVKFDLISNIYKIMQLSVDSRKKIYAEMKHEQKMAIQAGNYKRLSVKEHCERVRFDPTQVEKQIQGNQFKLIYPQTKDQSSSSGQYEKFQRKANEFWQVLTGTLRQAPPPPPKKKKLLKKNRKQSQQIQLLSSQQANDGDSSMPTESTRKQSEHSEDTNKVIEYSTTPSNVVDATIRLGGVDNGTSQSKGSSCIAAQTQAQSFFDKRQQVLNKVINDKQHVSPQPNYNKRGSFRSTTSNNQANNSRPQQTNVRQTTKSFQAKQICNKHRRTLENLTKPIMSEYSRSTINEAVEQRYDVLVMQSQGKHLSNHSKEEISTADLMSQLQNHQGHLRYKEFCKELGTEVNSLQYRTAIAEGKFSGANEMNFSSANQNCWFLSKLKSIISNQPMSLKNECVQYKSTNGLSNLISPATNRQMRSDKYSSLYKSKEQNNTFYNLGLGQKGILRSESINNNKTAADLASVNMSQGVLDFKVQYKKQQRKFQSQAPKNQVNSNANKNNVAPKCKLMFMEDSDLVNLVGSIDDSIGGLFVEGNVGVITQKAKREMKKRQVLSIETCKKKNLDKLREYEKRLLLNANPTYQ